uniref:BY PROTMAP: gi/472584086/gb/EMS21692.1/ tetratricopeptide repeat containing protein [Rhodosporidium toruloides NP11] gi/647394591/emb/CDR35822.1/ RHTO0S01e07844g1_1 [Rhodosporidium toruloides] n=1 Tax=Rhodotorula toruloides TaxID=5286 RepID=A0A0K3CQ68_RHOTO
MPHHPANTPPPPRPPRRHPVRSSTTPPTLPAEPLAPTLTASPEQLDRDRIGPDSPRSDTSAPFSIRSAQLRASRSATLSPAALGGVSPPQDLFALASAAQRAEGEELFGPSPSLTVRSLPRAEDGEAEGRRRLREKYAVGRDGDEKLQRLLEGVWGGYGGLNGYANGHAAAADAFFPPPTSPPLRPPPEESPPLDDIDRMGSPLSSAASRRSERRRQREAILSPVLSAFPPTTTQQSSPHRQASYPPLPAYSRPHPHANADTPDPSLPSFPDPSHSRPALYRTLHYSYLPSRTARRTLRGPTVDEPLSEYEKEWVEKTGRVRDDGGLVDWWGNQVGERGDWGRTVLSPIVTETEPTHSSPEISPPSSIVSSSRYVVRRDVHEGAYQPLVVPSGSGSGSGSGNSSERTKVGAGGGGAMPFVPSPLSRETKPSTADAGETELVTSLRSSHAPSLPANSPLPTATARSDSSPISRDHNTPRTASPLPDSPHSFAYHSLSTIPSTRALPSTTSLDPASSSHSPRLDSTTPTSATRERERHGGDLPPFPSPRDFEGVDVASPELRSVLGPEDEEVETPREESRGITTGSTTRFSHAATCETRPSTNSSRRHSTTGGSSATEMLSPPPPSRLSSAANSSSRLRRASSQDRSAGLAKSPSANFTSSDSANSVSPPPPSRASPTIDSSSRSRQIPPHGRSASQPSVSVHAIDIPSPPPPSRLASTPDESSRRASSRDQPAPRTSASHSVDLPSPPPPSLLPATADSSSRRRGASSREASAASGVSVGQSLTDNARTLRSSSHRRSSSVSPIKSPNTVDVPLNSLRSATPSRDTRIEGGADSPRSRDDDISRWAREVATPSPTRTTRRSGPPSTPADLTASTTTASTAPAVPGQAPSSESAPPSPTRNKSRSANSPVSSSRSPTTPLSLDYMPTLSRSPAQSPPFTPPSGTETPRAAQPSTQETSEALRTLTTSPSKLTSSRRTRLASVSSGKSMDDVARWARQTTTATASSFGGAKSTTSTTRSPRSPPTSPPPTSPATASDSDITKDRSPISASTRSPTRSSRTTSLTRDTSRPTATSSSIGPDLSGHGNLSLDSLSSSSRPTTIRVPTSAPPPSTDIYLEPTSAGPFSSRLPSTATSSYIAPPIPDAFSPSFAADIPTPAPSSASFPSPSASEVDSGSTPLTPPSTARRFVKPLRPGPFPVPILTEEERVARRAFRKTGRSKEYDLPCEKTKMNMRRRAWEEMQKFEKEKIRLLQMLGDAELGRHDVPIVNALAHLHLGAAVPSARREGIHFLQQSLVLDESQPDIAHLLAVELEDEDLDEALHWHRHALQLQPDNLEHLLSLGLALTRLSDYPSAANAFLDLSNTSFNTPYEAIGLYELGRAYEATDEAGPAREAYEAALDCLARLRLINPTLRSGARWSGLNAIEETVLDGLGRLGGGRSGEGSLQSRASPAPTNLRSFASPATLRRPASAFTSARNTPLPFDEAVSPPRTPVKRSPSKAPSSIDSPPPSRNPTPSLHEAVPPPSRSPLHHKRRRKVDPATARTLDAIAAGLRDMARSGGAAQLAESSRLLADEVDLAYQRLRDQAETESQLEDALLHSIEALDRELHALPDKLIATARLAAARPPGVPPPPGSVAPLDSALRKLEKARQLAK